MIYKKALDCIKKLVGKNKMSGRRNEEIILEVYIVLTDISD